MWVVNYQKESARIRIRNSIQSCITNVTCENNAVSEILAAISNAVAGSTLNIDVQLKGDCNAAIGNISNALQQLYACLQLADQIDVMEEIPDD